MFGTDFTSRHMPTKPEPLDVGFNAAVMALARANNPRGWDVIDSYVLSPHSLSDLNRAVNSGGKVVVWAGDDTPTIYACKEHNAAFMAWHDAVHYVYQMPFNMAGEAAVAYVQIQQLLARYGHDDVAEEWAALILCEVLGQAMMNVQYGEWPQDEREFAVMTVCRWRPLATRLCAELSSEDATEHSALRLARETWGQA